jgi:hypothetical protein
LAFSCKGRGLCPSCGARRAHDVAEHLVERVLPDVPIRQYVLSPPSELVGLLAARPEALSALNRLFTAAIFDGIRARLELDGARHCGAVTFVQRFTKTLSCYPHLHVLALDGGYAEAEDETLTFIEDPGPTLDDLRALEARVLHRFGQWLQRRGYLDEQTEEPTGLDAWWLAAARAPCGVIARVHGGRREPGFEVHAGVRVAAGDERGRAQLVRYVTPMPEAPLRGASMDHCGVKVDCVDLAVLEVDLPSRRTSSRCSAITASRFA